ncbi:MAG: hypothetical protein PHY42_06985 [Bacilli bacterium]|nr:hypothetical protein [Bacilli bacterium]
MNEFLFWHQQKYPLMEDADKRKLLFQSEFAGNHHFRTKDEVMTGLNAEIKALNHSYEDLYVDIGNNYVRVNLSTYVKYQFPLNYLGLAFYDSAKDNNGTFDGYKQKLIEHELSTDDLDNHHHSEIYRTAYNPHYRVIDKKYITEEMKLVQLENFIANQGSSIIAIEGKCGGGKTTMVDQLSHRLTFSRIPMDDFFLPAKKKTTERLLEVGGNVDYERFLSLLEDIRREPSDTIVYQKYDCMTNHLSKVELKRHHLIIIEGVYSYHPAFRHLIDRLAFIEVDDVTQDLRLKRRTNYLSYVNTWVVLENIYYDHEKIKILSNIII